jgi:hypothetical protein
MRGYYPQTPPRHQPLDCGCRREGDWPQGLQMHSAATKPGGLVIYEIWALQADQERFMESRLGKALQDGGVEGPPEPDGAGPPPPEGLGLQVRDL